MLFEDSPASSLVGIAKLAAESELLQSKKRVEYFELETRSFIGRNTGARMPFIWTINPYRGCEFGCKYCYARYAHEFMELRDPVQFERKIYAKRFYPASFRAELKKVKPGESIWIGTATDPYQPAERRYKITRRMLEVFAKEKGRSLGITTKSDLVARDADLLVQIGKRNQIQVNLSVTTTDPALARLIEPMAPRPDLRLDAVRVLSEASVRVSVLAHPVMPLINDSEESLDAVCAAAAAAGAKSFSAAPLFLKPCSKQVFLPFLEQNFPNLLRRYRERYEHDAYLRGHYPEMLKERVGKLVARYGLNARDILDDPPEWPGNDQLALFR
jgi:DNA repair photolyase